MNAFNSCVCLVDRNSLPEGFDLQLDGFGSSGTAPAFQRHAFTLTVTHVRRPGAAVAGEPARHRGARSVWRSDGKADKRMWQTPGYPNTFRFVFFFWFRLGFLVKFRSD